jgi:hypothetical protein
VFCGVGEVEGASAARVGGGLCLLQLLMLFPAQKLRRGVGLWLLQLLKLLQLQCVGAGVGLWPPQHHVLSARPPVTGRCCFLGVSIMQACILLPALGACCGLHTECVSSGSCAEIWVWRSGGCNLSHLCLALLACTLLCSTWTLLRCCSTGSSCACTSAWL